MNKLIPSFIVVLFATTVCAETPKTMRQYQFSGSGEGTYELVQKEVPTPVAGPNDVLVRVRATSLNRRDIYIINNAYSVRSGGGSLAGSVPLSDGAGEVISVGKDVVRFKVGDRVAGTFFSDWVEGKSSASALKSARGFGSGGMLSEFVVTGEQGLVAIPKHLSYEEGATLPCAGLTAWVGLFRAGGLKPGDYVLLEGTGGVSSFGLIFAAAAGARPVITSSSDEKLSRARELGAIGTVNYRENDDWEVKVRELTGDVGVDHVLEIGGTKTIEKAMRAMGFGAHMALIGGVTGFANTIPVNGLMSIGASATGVYVGSRADFEAMNKFIEKHELRPLIDRTFTFDQAPDAFELMENGSFMGKIVITL